ncbi:uncharacterized protein LOC117643925 [Thrips palmi]|uniref:Uncharacterized protein LOC117643925 n=1 Tax=Thrips palmi TaxID=161013 RepID=A0A6P8YGX8_THRPL|nr:uncharacterized protein LOC117643925 [Thrips palmi]
MSPQDAFTLHCLDCLVGSGLNHSKPTVQKHYVVPIREKAQEEGRGIGLMHTSERVRNLVLKGGFPVDILAGAFSPPEFKEFVAKEWSSGRPGRTTDSHGVKDTPRHATRWAVFAVLAAMLTLFICLLFVDFTQTARSPSRRAGHDEPAREPGQPGHPGAGLGVGESSDEAAHHQDDVVEDDLERQYGAEDEPEEYLTRRDDVEDEPEDYLARRDDVEDASDDHLARQMDAEDEPAHGTVDEDHGHTEDAEDYGGGQRDEDYYDAPPTGRAYRSLAVDHAGDTDVEPPSAPSGNDGDVQGREVNIVEPQGGEESPHDEEGVEVSTEPPPYAAPLSAEDRSDDGQPDDAVALPYHVGLDVNWPRADEPLQQQRARERWLERMQEELQSSLKAARRHQDLQRRNGVFAELGTIQGEQMVLPHYTVQDNLGPVLFPASTKQHQQQLDVSGTHFVPKKLMKLMVSLQGGGNKPWAFPQQVSQAPNQYLVVNNKGVVIPHSVNFPDIVKTANFPQLQPYRNPHSSSNKHLQDVANYLKSKGYVVGGRRPYAWSGAALKKAAKVTGVYGGQQMQQAVPQEAFPFPRPEPYVNDMAFMDSAESMERPGPDSHYNGHAYVADPFHPYKPSDPTEINHMASAMDSEVSASASSESVRHSGFVDEVGEPFAPAGRPALPGLPGLAVPPGRFARHRHPFLQPGGPQYTEATFKPLGPDTAASTTPAASDAAWRGAAGKSVPPLSVMLEIFPMGQAKANDGAATVMWNNLPVAALRPVVRRPPSVTAQQAVAQHVAAQHAAQHAVAHQAESSLRRPVALPFDPMSLAAASPVASSASSGANRFPVLMQGQLSAGNGQPFGVTLSGLQGLQSLAGMPMLDSKHKMVVHLNFYPKKSVSLPMRFRDSGTSDNIGQGASILQGGTFAQRRQSVPEDQAADPLGSVAVDLAPLLQSLPPDMQGHLMAILQTYQRAAPAKDTVRDAVRDGGRDGGRDGLRDARSDEYLDEDSDVDSSGESAEEYDDEALLGGRRPKTKDQRPVPRTAGGVDAEPSFNSVEDSGEVPSVPQHVADWLAASAPKKTAKAEQTPAAAKDSGSYFDVQEDADKDDSVEDTTQPAITDEEAAKANKRFMEEVEEALRDRMTLWRHWKQMQQQQKGSKWKRKKTPPRTQRDSLAYSDAVDDVVSLAEGASSAVPKNHRLN